MPMIPVRQQQCSNNMMMLGHNVVKRDRVHSKDIGWDAATKIGEGMRWGSSDPWAVATGVSVAAPPLDGIIPFRCKLTHACAHPLHWAQDIDRGTQFDMPSVWTAHLSKSMGGGGPEIEGEEGQDGGGGASACSALLGGPCL